MQIKKIAMATLVAASLIASTAHAELVSNGGFETGTLSGWTQGGNTGYTGVTGSPYAHTGTYGLYLGPVGSNGSLSQTLVTTNGATYRLDYWLASDGGTPNGFSAMIGSSTLFAQTNIAAQGFTEYSFSFVGTGSDTLTFAFRNDPSYLSLDDISVVQTNAVPEPASLLLLGLGLAGLATSHRRKTA